MSFNAFQSTIKWLRNKRTLHRIFNHVRLNPTVKPDDNQFLFLARIGHLDFIHFLESFYYTDDVKKEAFLITAHQKVACQSKITMALISGNHIDNDALIEAVDYVLQDSASAGNPDLVEYLLTKPYITPSINSQGPLIEASRRGNASCVKALLSHPLCCPSINNNEPIRVASRNGRVKVVKLLLLCKDKGIDPKAQDNEALIQSASRGHFLIVLLLLDAGCDFRARDHQAIYLSYKNNHVEVFQHLLALALKTPQASDYFILRFACSIGDLTTLTLLVSTNINIDITTKDNYCLRVSCQKGYTEMVEYLLKYTDCDPSARQNACLKSAIHGQFNDIQSLLIRDDRVQRVMDLEKMMEKQSSI